MKTEQTPVNFNHDFPVDPEMRFANKLADDFTKRMTRIWNSRRRNIRRAWRLRKNFRTLAGISTLALEINHDQLAEVTRQRDEAVRELQKIKAPKDEILCHQMFEGEILYTLPTNKEELYLTQHSHFTLTAKLRARVKELEKNSSLFLSNDSEKPTIHPTP